MSEIKLKPCPFCGTMPYTSIVKSSDEKMKIYIQCDSSECGAKMDFTIEAENGFLDFDDVINGISKAAEAWNRRVDNESRTDKERSEARQRESL